MSIVKARVVDSFITQRKAAFLKKKYFIIFLALIMQCMMSCSKRHPVGPSVFASPDPTVSFTSTSTPIPTSSKTVTPSNTATRTSTLLPTASMSPTVTPTYVRINIPDPVLESQIRLTLSKPTGDIYREESQDLTVLFIVSKAVNNLEGVQYFPKLTELLIYYNTVPLNIDAISGMTGLTWMNLYRNTLGINSLDPIAGLTGLFHLDLGSSNITDIDAIVQNCDAGGLGPSSVVDLRGNTLSYKALHTDIPYLISKGVNVKYNDPGTSTATPTITGTYTISCTHTISPTWSISPTFTNTKSVTLTKTATPTSTNTSTISPTASITPTFGPGTYWAQSASGTTFAGRYWHTGTVYDGKMWAVSGYVGTIRNDVIYSSDGTNWYASTTYTAAHGRWGAGCVAFDPGSGEKMWLIGGFAGSADIRNDVWYSTDGAAWSCSTHNGGFEGRFDHTCLVFNNKIWVIAGEGSVNLYLNDVWSSSDGITFTCANASAAFPPRQMHSSVVFDDGTGLKMWVIGGMGTGGNELNDVWSSSDGVNWQCATASAPFGPRRGHLSWVYNNMIWVSGGTGGLNGYADAWASSDGKNWWKATNNATLGHRYRSLALIYDAGSGPKIWCIGGENATGNSDEVWFSPPGP